jgi:hypothetical protein
MIALSAAPGIADAADFQFYRTVKHSSEIMLQGRTVDDLRDMRPVDPHGLKLGEIDGVLIDDSGLLIDQNKIAAVILDLRSKIAKNKKVLIAVEDVKFDPTNRKQLIIDKSEDELRAMRSWGKD